MTTCEGNIQFFSVAKFESFIRKFLIFLTFLLKTLIVGTCLNCLAEAVQTTTHNLCFGSKIKNILLQTLFFLYKSGVYGGLQSASRITDQPEKDRHFYSNCLHHLQIAHRMYLLYWRVPLIDSDNAQPLFYD